MLGFVSLLLPAQGVSSKGKTAQCPCVFAAFVCRRTCKRGRLGEEGRGRQTDSWSLSKLIREGIGTGVKYWATCNERSRVRDILGSGPHQTVVLGQSGIDFHSFGDEGGWGWRWGWTREGEGGRETERGSTAESKGLASCQLDSLTPFGGEQTNRGISWADSVGLS